MIFFSDASYVCPLEYWPDIKVHEGVEADDVVGDVLDGVVVEQEPLQAVVAGAFCRDLHQSVAGQIWKNEQKLKTDPNLTQLRAFSNTN